MRRFANCAVVCGVKRARPRTWGVRGRVLVACGGWRPTSRRCGRRCPGGLVNGVSVPGGCDGVRGRAGAACG